MAGVDIPIGADTREYAQAVKAGMIEPVGDAAKALDDLVPAGADAGQQLERTFSDQQRTTTELRRKIDDLNGSIKSGFRGSTTTARRDVDDFRERSTEGFDEIKDSARSNAIEVGASFTGGFDQAVGGLQGFLAEFLAGFGPGGVIAGVGIAALLGVISSAIEGGTESAEAQKQAVSDLAGEYIEAGGTGKRSFDSVKAAIESMATSKPEDVVITLQRAWQLAKQSGQDYAGVVQAIASGSPAQIDAARRELGRIEAQHIANQQAAAREGRGNAQAAATSINATGKLDKALESASKTAREAARAQKLAAEAGLSQFALKAGEIAQLESAFDEAASGVDKYLRHEGKILDVSDYLKAMRRREKSLEEYHDALAKADLSPAAVKFLESQGADTAAAMLRGYQKASPAQQRELGRIWTTAGNDNATTYQDAVGKKLKGTPISAPKIEQPKVPLADTAAIDAQLRQPKYMRVVLDVVDRKGQRLYP